jgi:hypothetical protein
MRNLILAVMLISLSAESIEDRQILIPSRAAEFIAYFDNVDVLATDGDAAIVQIADSAIEEWSEFVHEHFGLCGGFVDVSGDRELGKNPTNILKRYRPSSTLMPYTVPTIVVHNDKIAALVESTASDFIRAFLTELTSFSDRSATT